MTPEQLQSIRERLNESRKRAVKNVAGCAHYEGQMWITREVKDEPPYLVSLQRWQWGVEHTREVPIAEIAHTMTEKEKVELIMGRDDIAALLDHVDAIEKQNASLLKEVAIYRFLSHLDWCPGKAADCYVCRLHEEVNPCH